MPTDPNIPTTPPPLLIETERDSDGRWIAEIPSLPGCMAYGATRWTAILEAVAIAAAVEEGE